MVDFAIQANQIINKGMSVDVTALSSSQLLNLQELLRQIFPWVQVTGDINLTTFVGLLTAKQILEMPLNTIVGIVTINKIIKHKNFIVEKNMRYLASEENKLNQ